MPTSWLTGPANSQLMRSGAGKRAASMYRFWTTDPWRVLGRACALASRARVLARISTRWHTPCLRAVRQTFSGG
jgi:hypothetical protein